MRHCPVFFDFTESALLVDFGAGHDKALSLEILDLSERLMQAGLLGLTECIPALSSLTVLYDPLQLPRERLAEEIELLNRSGQAVEDRGQSWEIPVVYGGERGPDLKEVAAHAGLSEGQAAELHASPLYRVYMLGFLPGFAYLGDLPEPLRMPRRKTPRPRIPAGSVAIAADMTAVYPLESPGGWHAIGSAPLTLWDMAREDEPLLKPGDRVRFVPISEAEAEALRAKAAAGWRPEPVKEA
jgi:KipI family sensor histidine kinase inhibitor